METIIAKKVGI